MITIICIILFIICLALLVKIFFMKKSINEIKQSVKSILKTDTNNLITISSSDKDIESLTNELNGELKDLRKQRLLYENGNQELKKLITNISHDMRTPLTAISGYIDLIKESENLEKQRDYLKIVENKTNELTQLTEQLFDFSKTMDIGTNINKEKCLINELLEETIANNYVVLKNNDITPKVEITKNKIYRNVDRNSMIRVFENILSNIVKYSNGNFKVILDDNGKITFSNKAKTLDATTVQKIFDRYYTVENAKKSTGLGLSIAKQLVELNGGSINAKYIKGNLIIEIEL